MQRSDIQRMAHDILEKQVLENSYIEYKKSAQFKDKILKTACAFANNYMNNEIGLIFIGVEEVDDKETKEKAIPKRPISGIKEAMIESIENQLKSLLSYITPKISYQLIQDKIDDKYYIVIAVEPSVKGPCQTTEKAEKDKEIGLKSGRYIRVSRDSKLPNTTEEFELLKKFANFNFSSSLNKTATLDDLSYEYMKEYLTLTEAKEDLRNLSKLEMAKALGLIDESEYGGFRAKNFAVLMFCEKPNRFIPNAQVEIIREIDGTDKMERTTFDAPVWLQAKQVVRYFQDNIMRSYTLRYPDRMEHKIIYNYPVSAFEELATNAILHKEYDEDEYVGIYVYKDRISFVNPNRPLPPVTIEALNKERSFDKRQYLNKELKDMFYALDLIESYGSGIRRAKEAMEANLSPDIVFLPNDDLGNYTNAIIYIQPEFLKENFFNGAAKEVAPEIAPEIAPENSMGVQITRLMRENPRITIKEIAQRLDVSVRGVKYNINLLKENGRIERRGSTKSGTWVVLK